MESNKITLVNTNFKNLLLTVLLTTVLIMTTLLFTGCSSSNGSSTNNSSINETSSSSETLRSESNVWQAKIAKAKANGFNPEVDLSKEEPPSELVSVLKFGRLDRDAFVIWNERDVQYVLDQYPDIHKARMNGLLSAIHTPADIMYLEVPNQFPGMAKVTILTGVHKLQSGYAGLANITNLSD